jgi:peroxiredoxin
MSIMKKTSLFLALLFIAAAGFSQGYSVGDKASDFRLKNVDGSYVSLSDYPDAKGFIIVFSCNHCPYVVAYEDRMISLNNKYAPKGFPLIAINPNDSVVQPQDSFTAMKVRAKEKGFTFPYLLDSKQSVYPKYGATRTPHVYLLERVGSDLKVAYIGAIDDNHRDANQVNDDFLANAIDALLVGKRPEPAFTRAIGCTIKARN